MIVKRVRVLHLSDGCEDMHVSMSDYCWYPTDTCVGSPRPSDPYGRDKERVRNTKAEVPLGARQPPLNGILLSSRVPTPSGIRHSAHLNLMSVTTTQNHQSDEKEVKRSSNVQSHRHHRLLVFDWIVWQPF